jgi:antitoxin (DNA-binding transcriptional repressor) of toxin-antitoxin stability system
MKTVNVHEAKTHSSKLLGQLERSHQSIAICRNGAPVADLVPHRPTRRTRKHPTLSKIKIGYEPVESLSAEEWPEAAR